MRSLLFHAIPSERPRDWSNFRREAADLALPGGAEQLAENVWIFPANQGTDLLLGRIARRHAIASRCLSIVHKSEWQNLP
jgi:hypothetical protein